MNDDNRQRAQALVNRLLHEAGDKTAEGNYKAALTAVKKAKALDQTNVYILALERQVEQIQELSITGIVTEEQKGDILGSIPNLVDQAIRADSALTKADGHGSTREETPGEREARDAAGRWLKNQYFQRAYAFVQKSEYDHALTELRKTFSIDDQDRVAREFELKIVQMLELQRHEPPLARPEPVAPALRQEPSPALPPLQRGGDAGKPPAGKKGSGTLWMAVIVTMAIVILAAFYFWNRQHSTPPVPTINESDQEKAEETPVYPVPPPQLPTDTTRTDTASSG